MVLGSQKKNYLLTLIIIKLNHDKEVRCLKFAIQSTALTSRLVFPEIKAAWKTQVQG